MALDLVTARARTRGKSPKEFTFRGIGRIVTRKVTDKDGNPIIVDEKNEQVAYSFDKEGKITGNENIKQDEKGNLILSGNLRFVEVDELDTKSVTEDLQDVLNLFGSLSDEDRGKVKVSETDAEGKVTVKEVPRSPLQMVIDSALDGYNYNARKLAAPVTEQVTEDELTPITAAMVEYKVMSEQDATTWRRTITQAAKLMESERLDYAKMTPQYKKLVAAGYKEAA